MRRFEKNSILFIFLNLQITRALRNELEDARKLQGTHTTSVDIFGAVVLRPTFQHHAGLCNNLIILTCQYPLILGSRAERFWFCCSKKLNLFAGFWGGWMDACTTRNVCVCAYCSHLKLGGRVFQMLNIFLFQLFSFDTRCSRERKKIIYLSIYLFEIITLN